MKNWKACVKVEQAETTSSFSVRLPLAVRGQKSGGWYGVGPVQRQAKENAMIFIRSVSDLVESISAILGSIVLRFFDLSEVYPQTSSQVSGLARARFWAASESTPLNGLF